MAFYARSDWFPNSGNGIFLGSDDCTQIPYIIRAHVLIVKSFNNKTEHLRLNVPQIDWLGIFTSGSESPTYSLR